MEDAMGNGSKYHLFLSSARHPAGKRDRRVSTLPTPCPKDMLVHQTRKSLSCQQSDVISGAVPLVINLYSEVLLLIQRQYIHESGHKGSHFSHTTRYWKKLSLRY